MFLGFSPSQIFVSWIIPLSAAKMGYWWWNFHDCKEELHGSVPLTRIHTRHLNPWSASEKLILKCEQRLQVQTLCKYWAGTVLMPIASNLMSNILIIVTHISNPRCVATKTLPLPDEDQCVCCAPSAWVWRHISHYEFFWPERIKHEIQRGLSNSVGGTKDWNLNRRHTDRLRKRTALCNLLNFLKKSSIASQPNVPVCPLGSCLYSSLWKKQDVSM